MLDAKVIRSCVDSREAFDKVKDHLNENELSPQAQVWLPMISQWYDQDKLCDSIDQELMLLRGEQELPEQHLDTLLGWFRDLPEVESPANVVNYVLDLKRYVKGNELCHAIQGRHNEKVDGLLEEYSELRKATTIGRSEIQWAMDNGDMDSLLDRENLVKVGPAKLNDRLLGGAVEGDAILIFGRPEAGKTLFTVNMVAGFLKFGHRVLYIGNEENVYKTRKRIVNNLSNRDNDAYASDTEGTIQAAEKNGLNNLFICHMQPGSPAEIEELVKEVQPKIVVVDQIRNLELPKVEKLTDRLGELSTQLRSLAGKHKFIHVAVTQAGDKTERHGQEPPMWLTMSDIADNRTSMAAQFDVIIGVGCTEELRRNSTRAISLCKNKLSDREDAHEGFMVHVDVRKSIVR